MRWCALVLLMATMRAGTRRKPDALRWWFQGKESDQKWQSKMGAPQRRSPDLHRLSVGTFARVKRFNIPALASTRHSHRGSTLPLQYASRRPFIPCCNGMGRERFWLAPWCHQQACHNRAEEKHGWHWQRSRRGVSLLGPVGVSPDCT